MKGTAATFHLSAAPRDYEKVVAVGFFSLTVLTAALTYVCVRKTFPPPR